MTNEVPVRLTDGVDTYNPDVEGAELKFKTLKNCQPRFGRWVMPQGLVTIQVLEGEEEPDMD